MNRLLLDQGLPRSTVELLRSDGWDVVHVYQCGLSAGSDEQILEYARTHGRVVSLFAHSMPTFIQFSPYLPPRALRWSAYAGRGYAGRTSHWS